MIRVLVSPAPIDLADEMALAGQDGALATFTGMVRADDGVTELMLEHYPGATERALTVLAEEAVLRWSLSGVTIVHRVGPMRLGDRIVFVAASGAHRAEALDACAFLIDRLKTDAPFWKRERVGDHHRWVEPRASDDVSAEKWR
ncbi:molybdenum cofactor biosynthesis protein MoaE [Sphingomonas mucosissima]|uniref:Molybdopterin synthase catalytic subunit n=1 Tax=Sphingomonas mucosissima TaxID=370959 RepID=A0A245ZST8_9SPHN|nr:molybdenum cofactor biosynthesis protein MoaE [Sphingomonas mucosissima]OWK32770.1 molybdopterin synthase catalytic subunit [Sphingomonas mucosissima]